MEQASAPLPLLSIVIASRNRVSYARSTIESILEVPDPRLELVVQDNSESRELESYVCANITDSRFRYQYTPPRLSMIDNFNAAVELATGEYVCVIGDDDGVNPEIVEAAAWAKGNDLDALTSRNILMYQWPDTRGSSTFLSGGKAGGLYILEYTGQFYEVDVKHEVLRLVRNGGVYYLSFHLPKLYHGLVRRRCLDDIHKTLGAYFGGLSPDIYSAITISEAAARVMFIDYPLTIAGAGRAALDCGGVRKLENAPLFRDRGEYHWCDLVPRVYCSETIWVDSEVAALRAMGRDDLVQELNLPKLAAYCIGRHPGITAPVLRDLFAGLRIMRKNRGVGAICFAWSLLTGPGVKFGRWAWKRLLKVIGIGGMHRIDGLANMVEVSRALTRHLNDNRRSFADVARRRTEAARVANAKAAAEG